jgi:hypothetical protein
VSIAQHRRPRWVLDALGKEERAVLPARIGDDRAGKAHALEGLGELDLEVLGKRRGALRILALGRNGHAAREVLEEAAIVEIPLGGEDGLRAAHGDSIAPDGEIR